ncbi:MAG: hypothetical protein HN576_03990 [Bacteriovoracaceae bacterium]|jgi:hypothetical protein|nr:hypothetical protein [Bacteriovoracaceae bacterium]
MNKHPAISIVFALVIFFGLGLSHSNAESDLQFKIQSKLFKNAFDQAMSYLVDQDGYFKKNLPDQKYEYKIKLSDHMEISDPHFFGEKLLGLNLQGDNSLHFLMTKPTAQAKIKFFEPIFNTSDKKDELKVELNIEIENYLIQAEKFWFKEHGFTNSKEANEDACYKQIKSGKYWDKKISEKYAPRLKKFVQDIDDEDYATHAKRIWARIDQLEIGYMKNSSFRDSRNKIKVKVIGIVNLKKGAETLSIERIEHNLDDEDGAKIRVDLLPENMITPPIFFRTRFAKVDANGYMLKDEQGSQVWEIRCSPIDLMIAKEYAASLVQDLSKNLYKTLTSEMTQKLVEQVNQQIKSQKIPDLPTSFALQRAGGNYLTDSAADMTMDISREVEAGFYETLTSILGQFYQYRISLGLKDISTENAGKSLLAKVNASLSIDQDQLVYHENLNPNQFLNHKNFKFDRHGDDIAFAFSGKMLQKIINLLKNRILKASLPEWIAINIEDDSYKVNSKGQIVFSPRLQANIKGKQVVKFNIDLKIKPEIIKQGEDYILKINTQIPSGKEILRAISAGDFFEIENRFVSTALWVPSNIFSWVFDEALAPLLGSDFVIDQTLGLFLEDELQTIVHDFRNNKYKLDVTNYVERFGIAPYAITFTADGYMSLYISLKEDFYNNNFNLKTKMIEIKEGL